MNVTLTGKELLHVLHTLVTNPLPDPQEQQSLLEKVKRPILTTLEKEQDRIDTQAYQTWTEQEAKKISELKQKNLDIKPIIKQIKKK